MNNIQKHLEKAIKVNPEYSEAHYELGIIFSEKKEYKLAKQHLLKVTKIDPDFAMAYFHLALLYKKFKDNKKSKEYLKKSID